MLAKTGLHPGLLGALGLLVVAAPALAAERFATEVLADGLEYPWSLDFLPDGRMLLTERAGRLRVLAAGELQATPVAGVPPVYAASQGGLFEVLADPDFASNQIIYLSFVHGDRQANATRLIRARLADNSLQDIEVLFTARPWKSTPVHHGGRLAWLPDGSLLLTLGDGFNYRERAQSATDHFGAIIRINRDGSIPADNPWLQTEGAQPELYSIGHRNVQGIVWHAGRGVLYAHEHGPRGGDELNLIRAGQNYGWPVTSHGVDYSGARVTPYRRWPGMEEPLLQWTPSIAPAGMTVVSGELFADWEGDLLVAALAARHVQRLRLHPDGSVSIEEILFAALGERLRDVRSGPDGALYLLTDSEQGQLLRVTPAP